MTEQPFNVRTATLYPWLAATNAYDTAITFVNFRGVSFEPEYDTDELYNYGAQEEGLSVLIGGTGVLYLGGLDEPALAKIFNTSNSSSGANTNINDDDAGTPLAYFGLGVAVPVQGGGEYHIYWPKLVATSGLVLEIGEDNKFLKPEVDYRAFRLRVSGSTYKVRYRRKKATTTALEAISTVIGLS